jgi:ribosomal protein S1
MLRTRRSPPPWFALSTSHDLQFGFSLYLALQTKPDDVAVIDNVRPGMLVKAAVSGIVQGGLWVRFLDYFGGVVGLLHLDKVVADGLESLKKAYKVGQKLKARILYVDYENKHIGLTVQSHVVKLNAYAGEKVADIGTTFENAVVSRVDSGVGLVLSLPTEPALAGYVHVRLLFHIFSNSSIKGTNFCFLGISRWRC